MIENQCTYYGVKLDAKPGDKIRCVLCDATLIAVNRNGRAWINKHERKTPIHIWHYTHHTAGNNSVRSKHDAR